MNLGIWRWIRIHILRIKGAVDESSDGLMEDSHVTDAAFSNAIAEHTSKMVRLSSAVAQLKADKKAIERERDGVAKQLAEIKEAQEGAAYEGEDLVAKLRKQGLSQDKIEADKDYIAAMDFFDEQEATIAQMEGRLAQLTQRNQAMAQELENRKVQWQEMQRRGEELKLEKNAAAADMNYAKAMLALNTAFASVDSQSDVSQDLTAARAARDRVVARAELAGEMTGQDSAVKRAKYADNVRKRRSASKFADRVGLSQKAESEGTDSASAEKTAVAEKGDPPPLS